jgi:serine phosphatase RsbU (regulator of sigma subunit)
MQELWASASYQPQLLSLPFAFAPTAMIIVIAYALVMRGEPALRGWMLLHFAALLPYSVMMTLSPSIRSPEAANALFRFAAAFIPLAAAAGAGFQLRLLGKHRPWRWFVRLWLAAALAWIPIGAWTDLAIEGVRWLPIGLWYGNAGDFAWLVLAITMVVTAPGFFFLGIAAWRGKPSPTRRQLRMVLAANLITYAGLTDVALAYELGVFPIGWLLSGLGSVVVARALVVEDLLRVRAVDLTAPRLVLHFAAACLLGWIALRLIGAGLTWWGSALVLAVSFAAVRVTIAVSGLINRGARGGESTLDRLLSQLVSRARPLEREPDLARLATDIVELGLGVRVEILIAAADDYGWSTPDGARLDDAAAPDPLLGAWLAEQRHAIFTDELDHRVPADLRELLGTQLERHRATCVVPVASHDELLALVLVPPTARRIRGRELGFLERASERFGEALVHARMAQRATEHARLAREVELAATVQAQLLPGRGPHVHGEFTLVGSWAPATRCAGDFWGVYPLGDRRVLVAIGDVTGHGVASATVTAAAAAAVEVAVRRFGARLALDALVGAVDAAVRRVGGGELTMTCFASILDPDAREIRFVSCGHTFPYLVRGGDAATGVVLQALVGRGNPLGGGGALAAKVLHKPLEAGDLVVWYTDGVIDANDPAGHAFGDRRLQRLLRRLERAHLSPAALHDVVHAGVAAHRAGRPRDDDETLVVAQWQPREVVA